jgi:hypothetical protein
VADVFETLQRSGRGIEHRSRIGNEDAGRDTAI